MHERIVLKKGYQKKLIEDAKNKLSMPWYQLAIKLETGENYLRHELRNEYRTLSEIIFNKLCKILKINPEKIEFEKKDSNWGQIKGGKKKKHHPKKAVKLLCEKSVDLAEIIGIIIGDGSIYVNKKYGIYQVHIAGDSEKDKDYLTNYVKPLFEKTFEMGTYFKFHKTSKEMFVWKQSKDLVYTLNYHGLPSGNKKLNNIKIPKWIMKNEEFLASCIRGIFDTDGSVYPKNKANRYPSISITSAIPGLQDSITDAMHILGISMAGWRDKKTAMQATIQRRNDVIKFFNKVGFSNPKHSKRYKKYFSPHRLARPRTDSLN